VKNLLYFLTILLGLIFLIGCNPMMNKKQASKEVVCPNIFFSSEHKNFIYSDKDNISLDNLSFNATLNNYKFDKGCKKNTDILIFPLDILVIVNPILLTQQDIELPVYALLLDRNDKLIETQYFTIEASVDKDSDNNKFIETDIVHKLNIVTKNELVENLIIGFMLEKKKIEILN